MEEENKNKFRFEKLENAINWPKVVGTNVKRLERANDHESVLEFLPEVAVGDVDDGFIDFDSKAEIAAFRHLQLSIQYLLYSQEVLRTQKKKLDCAYLKLEKRQAIAKSRYLKKRSQLKLLKNEQERQQDILSTYHTMLQALDPDMAATLATDSHGRVIIADDDDYVSLPNSTADIVLSDDEDDRQSIATTILSSQEEETINLTAHKPMRLLLRSLDKHEEIDEADQRRTEKEPTSPMKRLRHKQPPSHTKISLHSTI
mmetsp:Transcript_6193/g.9231  ORF Transcript_6193/g.9231 Transcript_6193/m.9231 type:complete len:258 (-) Transcript_6193:117-890(-)|eukprot:CAMPEP_0197314790 /NCGR_PEP_ID=MMETSP0891-20130614/35236_1 /TAXON_ID=44058 ORGANISM="Aureoumbra lagunensis, Strain CCMP1510" /NCGR_SAMPLE_ID=MMETSP0891 /ASSEMBLY_ACC=CAM_ASM_000534 /LENGTH=257 /DNA_ID=CAMNT_0042803405 /DNA_START=29 /DNA_END=802 /DNA_ORIENTATION=-